MNYIGINQYDTANGIGIRVSLFVSGCRMHCAGCFNKASWDFSSGAPFTYKEVETILKALNKDYIEGFSLLGGEPFEKEHESTLVDLLKTIKERYPDKTIWAWTGKWLEDIVGSPLLDYIDVLIDGPFDRKLYEPSLKYRGSSNQRINFLNVTE